MDGHACKVLRWAMSGWIDAALVEEALRMVLGRLCPAAGLLYHADRGSQYAWSAYQAIQAEHGICGSMNCKRNCLAGVSQAVLWQVKGRADIAAPLCDAAGSAG